MNGEKKKQMDKKQMILLGIYGVSVVAFLVSLLLLGVLPVTYLLGIVLVLGGISFLLIKGLFGKEKGKKKKISAVLMIVLTVIFLVATTMISGAVSFLKNITAGDVQTYDYYVVVREESKYEGLDDIKDEKVFVLDRRGEAEDKAKKELQKKVKISYEPVAGLTELTEGLIDKKSNVIYLDASYYDMALEESDKFTKKNTRILDTIRIEVKKEKRKVNKDLTKEPFNVYISGIDTTGTISNASRSDVNMIMTVNPNTRKILLTSIPRDYYVKLHTYQAYDKLTHSGIYGINETTATVEDLMSIEIDHYIKVNFTTVTKLVDALGGITVDSDYDFVSRDGFYYTEGENELNGEEALSFARERKAFAAGDHQRVKNQQAVITAILDKATGSTAILTNYNSLLTAVSDNMETSMSHKDMSSLVKMQLGDMRGWKIQSNSLKGSGGSGEVYSMPGASVYVMEPDLESVEKAKGKIEKTMRPPEETKEEN